MTVKDDFLALLRAARADRLRAIDRAFDRAVKDDDQAALRALRDERRSLLDLPAAIVGGTRADFVARWPATLGELPLWFTDPEEAARLDPPGEPLVIDCSPRPAAPPSPVPSDLEAAILARRAEKAPAEDAARLVALEQGATTRARISRKLSAETSRKRR